MDIALGTHVWSSDSQDLGTIDRLILDPASGRIKSAVIRKGFLLPHDAEVPLDVLEAGPRDAVHVPYTADQIHTLPRFQPGDYTTPPPEYVPPMGYPAGAFYWPLTGYGAAVPPIPPGSTLAGGGAGLDREVAAEMQDALRRQDLQNAVIDVGSAVMSRDGKKVGEVQQLTFDPESDRLKQLVVRKGFLFTKETTLPAWLIAGVDDGVIYLAVDADDRRLQAA